MNGMGAGLTMQNMENTCMTNAKKTEALKEGQMDINK